MGDVLVQLGWTLTKYITLPIVVVFILFWFDNRRRMKD